MKRLSENTLQLGFMRKSLNRRLNEERDKIKQTTSEAIIRVYPPVLGAAEEPLPGLDGVTREHRFTWIEELVFGRFSFNGQNTAIEKLRSDKSRKRRAEDDDSCEVKAKAVKIG
ncbi:hypothetical protein M3Y97_00437700 [Aphelenchoides bicaudatus]|nr:hypothetical protein M3Y97_00437700 [Aphelenchoides bicaudatus]